MYKSSEILSLLKKPTRKMPQRMNLCLLAINEGEYVIKDTVSIGDKTLPRIKKGNFWVAWNDEIKQWFGAIENYLGPSYDSTSTIYCIEGPFRVSKEWRKLISFAYNDPDIPLRKIPRTSPQELSQAAARMLIRIVAGMPNGEPDTDMSIVVPLKQVILDILPEIPVENPVLTLFEEHKGRLFSHSTLPQWPRSFKAVKIGDLYLLFIEEINQWIGIGYKYEGRCYGEENIKVCGPFALTDYYLPVIEQSLKSAMKTS